MAKLFLSAFYMLSVFVLFGQPVPKVSGITKEIIETWPKLQDAGLSNDGKHAFYTVRYGGSSRVDLTVCRVDGSKQQHFSFATNPVFSENSKFLYFKVGDSLSILDLSNYYCQYVRNVSRFEIVTHANQDKVVYQLSNSNDLCLIENGGKPITISAGVDNFWLSNSKLTIAIEKRCAYGGELILFDLVKKRHTKISQAKNVIVFAFGSHENQYAYIASDSSHAKRELWICSGEDLYPNLVFKEEKIGTRSEFKFIEGYLRFSKSGTNLFFKLLKDDSRHRLSGKPEVSIWGYQDKYLRGQQRPILGPDAVKNYINVSYHLASKRFLLIDEHASIVGLGDRFEKKVIVCPNSEQLWFNEDHRKDSLMILDVETGIRKNILPAVVYSQFKPTFPLSPDDCYFVWFDRRQLHWFSCYLPTGEVKNISKTIPFPVYDREGVESGRYESFGEAGWINQDKSILLYDQFDIWKVSLDASSQPVNLTNGFGRSKRVVLTVANRDIFLCSDDPVQQLVLVGYDRETKNGGYWPFDIGKAPNLNKNDLSPFSVSSRMPVGIYDAAEGKVIKAKRSETYLVIRENAQSSANIFVTREFKKYRELSDIHPERRLNWLTAELINTCLADGKKVQGLLYKPAKFDSTKKYPIIFNYYEKRSDELHLFHLPAYSSTNINIPLFVQQGYLVFIQDIYSEPGHNGMGTLKALEAAANYAASLRYVDADRMGLQGHSYGGWQTNYLITHSSKFRAACEFAGTSNHVSAYGQLNYDLGTDRQRFYELESQGSPYGLGVTPYSHLSLYIENSPVFATGKVNTPLLMVHNKRDDSVPFEQGIELFLALRRAEKPVWFVQYEDGGHSLRGKSAEDFHGRMLQFFDHYLKGKPKPDWMLERDAFTGKSDDSVNFDLSEMQYQILIDEYEKGKRIPSFLQELAFRSWTRGDFYRVHKMASRFLSNIGEEELGNRDCLQLLQVFFNFSKDAVNGFAFDELNDRYMELVKKYESNNLTPASIRATARIANFLGKNAFSEKIAKSYIISLNNHSSLSEDEMMFVTDFTKYTDDPGFSLLIKHKKRINQTLGKDKAEEFINWAIERSQINPYIKRGQADWAIAEKNALAFGELGKEALLQSKVFYAFNNNQWNLLKDVADEWFVSYGSNRAWISNETLNRLSWAAFVMIEDKQLLNVIVKWIRLTIERAPSAANFDTYANLLYKTGQYNEAIQMQSKAIELSLSEGDIHNSELLDHYNKMKENIPTWR